MKKFIEKLIAKLEQIPTKNKCSECPHKQKCDEVEAMDKDEQIDLCGATIKALAIDAVKEITEEYKLLENIEQLNKGWIPCSERLPEKNQSCLVSYSGNVTGKYVDIDRFDGNKFCFYGIDWVIAWQPLPAPYKEGGQRMSNTNRDIEDYRSTLERYYEKGLNDGRNEVWELAKKIAVEPEIGGYDGMQLHDIFGFSDMDGVFTSYSPQEALAKLEAYEKEQNEIKVGDVVESTTTGKEFLIITEENDDSDYEFGVIDLEGMIIDRICNDTRYFKKTGKHIDIQSILQQIGGE